MEQELALVGSPVVAVARTEGDAKGTEALTKSSVGICLKQIVGVETREVDIARHEEAAGAALLDILRIVGGAHRELAVIEGIVEVAVPADNVVQLPHIVFIYVCFIFLVDNVISLIYRVVGNLIYGVMLVDSACLIQCIEKRVHQRQVAVVAESGIVEAVALKSHFEAELIAVAAEGESLPAALAVEGESIAGREAAVAHAEIERRLAGAGENLLRLIVLQPRVIFIYVGVIPAERDVDVVVVPEGLVPH